MTEPVYDLVVIGGGINGCGIARDAAGRGLSVFLCDKGDLAGGTSSASTKLIHGGLRYLEHYEFRLVREALEEREVLMALAPHIIWPLRFVLPHHKGLRPRWLLRLGLFLYDHLGGRKVLPATRSLDLSRDAAGAPLKPAYRHAFEYSDCWVQDSRLVVLNARDAEARGAVIAPRTACIRAERDGDLWRVTVQPEGGAARTLTARALVNAAGPWVGEVLSGAVRSNTPPHVRLVKGSHIVVRRLYDHDRAYIFQNGDGRIVFAIPYERDFTLIGTTDEDYHGDPAAVRISDGEIAYLCQAVNDYFAAPVSPADVVWTYSGVRPLYDDGATKAQEATRDYVVELDAPQGAAPLVSVFGGKITTYRRLAESVMEKFADRFTLTPSWTGRAILPGGDLPGGSPAALITELKAQHPYLAPAHVERLVRTYGADTLSILENVGQPDDMGESFGSDLTEREVRYLIAREWARKTDDILWRRTKLGLVTTPEQTEALAAFLARTVPA